MSSEVLGEVFEGKFALQSHPAKFADLSAEKIPLLSMGGTIGPLKVADTGSEEPHRHEQKYEPQRLFILQGLKD